MNLKKKKARGWWEGRQRTSQGLRYSGFVGKVRGLKKHFGKRCKKIFFLKCRLSLKKKKKERILLEKLENSSAIL